MDQRIKALVQKTVGPCSLKESSTLPSIRGLRIAADIVENSRKLMFPSQ